LYTGVWFWGRHMLNKLKEQEVVAVIREVNIEE
jgi:hypothetical protein